VGLLRRSAQNLAVALLLAVASAHARPQEDRPPNANGDYNFSFQEGGRQRQARQESGFGDDSEVVEGTYSYLTPEGEEVEVAYTANENGYFPTGPGIHPALARALEHLKRQNGIF